MASCTCSTAPTLIFPCSGGSDCGAVSDQAARKLTKDGVGKMFCLAGIGGHVEGIIANTKAAGKILAIDGCAQDCAKKTLEHTGFAVAAHVRMSDLGMEKGKTPANEVNVAKVAAKGAELLAGRG
jgi:uncharacterized metal-binding protein